MVLWGQGHDTRDPLVLEVTQVGNGSRETTRTQEVDNDPGEVEWHFFLQAVVAIAWCSQAATFP